MPLRFSTVTSAGMSVMLMAPAIKLLLAQFIVVPLSVHPSCFHVIGLNEQSAGSSGLMETSSVVRLASPSNVPAATAVILLLVKDCVVGNWVVFRTFKEK